MILGVVGYIHPLIISNFPLMIFRDMNYSHERFLKWFQEILFSNKAGIVPIFKSVKHKYINPKDIKFSKIQAYIIPKIAVKFKRLYSAILAISVYEHWIHEELPAIWRYMTEKNIFKPLVKDFFEYCHRENYIFFKRKRKRNSNLN